MIQLIVFIVLTLLNNNIFSQINTNSAVTNQNFKATTSQQIPNFNNLNDFSKIINDTVWVASDYKRSEDLYIFFHNNTQAIQLAKMGELVEYPKEAYPIRLFKQNPAQRSAIFIVASKNRLLYYSFQLITPYFMGVSAGYENPEPLEKITLEHYFNNGYIMQLVY
ncbi:hypothetical protein SAMN02745150_00613 [Brevinema andersonii]|uniref:Uncharacterized protein n=1 Tax=Brevinema andersonii TaxID=34097 RepID=A0A1I1DR90_BREAD|nr:hypothetical protein [Brevinema andersonii]SFB75210.1 hypothetical protein SAMN02745150_00613 [Brevinema andersonii]